MDPNIFWILVSYVKQTFSLGFSSRLCGKLSTYIDFIKKAFLFQIKGPAELDEQELSSIPDILQTYKGEISQLIAE